MTLYCPYCDSTDVRMRETVRSRELDPDDIGEKIITIKRMSCNECGEVFYAFSIFRIDGGYECVRRDQLESKTGIRIRSPLAKSHRRWA